MRTLIRKEVNQKSTNKQLDKASLNRFSTLLATIVGVPKDEIDKREKEWRNKKEQKVDPPFTLDD